MIVFDNSIYASGISTVGKTGIKGNSGEDCNCIYYVPYDLRTSNNVDFVLNKIKNNQLISDEFDSFLPENKEYSIKDFFYSSNGYIYQLNNDFTEFIEIGIIDELNYKIDSISLSSGTLTIRFSTNNYYYVIYYIDNNDFYPVSSIIETSGTSISNFPGTYSNILVKYVSKITRNSNFYKYTE